MSPEISLVHSHLLYDSCVLFRSLLHADYRSEAEKSKWRITLHRCLLPDCCPAVIFKLQMFSPNKSPSTKRSRSGLQGLALFLLAVLTYIPSMSNGFIWDDPQYVIDNPTLKSVDGLWRIWTDPTSTPQYYPMVHTFFWVEAQLWGTEHAPGFHVDNILLHALAAVLLWRVLIALEIPGTWLAAAIFAVHPVMVESVTWVTERKNVLSIVFYLLALIAYLKSLSSIQMPFQSYAEEPGRKQKKRQTKIETKPAFSPRHWYIASIVLFLLALLSKTVTCSLPAAILLILWWKRGKITFKDVKPLLPMLMLGVALSAVTSHLEHTRVGARGPDFNWSFPDRCLIAGHAICFYAMKIVWPHPLMFMYPKWDLHLNRELQLVYPAVVLIVVGALFVARRWTGRGPLVAVLFFIGTLFPAMGFVNIYPMRYSFVADHFQYLASLGLIALVAAGLSRLSKYTVVVIVPLIWLTWTQQSIYAGAKTLWQNTIAQNPGCWMAHTNLAGVLRAEKANDLAMVQSELALQLAPHEADTHYDYGVALAGHSRWDEAIQQFRLALSCDPQCAPAWSDLGRTLWDHGHSPQDQAEALEDSKNALQIQPNLADPHYVLARIAELRSDLPTAIDEYNKALAINDQDFHSHYNLGNCLLQTGHPGEAAGEYLKVLAHDNRNAMAWTNLGYAYLAVGRTAEAAQRFQQALVIKPDLAAAHIGLLKAQSQ
jgi:Tfp pilus assembly protein PilF